MSPSPRSTRSSSPSPQQAQPPVPSRGRARWCTYIFFSLSQPCETLTPVLLTTTAGPLALAPTVPPAARVPWGAKRFRQGSDERGKRRAGAGKAGTPAPRLWRPKCAPMLTAPTYPTTLDAMPRPLVAVAALVVFAVSAPEGAHTARPGAAAAIGSKAPRGSAPGRSVITSVASGGGVPFTTVTEGMIGGNIRRCSQ